MGRTSLDQDTYERCMKVIVRHLANNERVTNKDVRRLTGINYDQAIKLFNTAVELGVLERRGKASGVHYVRIPGP